MSGIAEMHAVAWAAKRIQHQDRAAGMYTRVSRALTDSVWLKRWLEENLNSKSIDRLLTNPGHALSSNGSAKELWRANLAAYATGSTLENAVNKNGLVIVARNEYAITPARERGGTYGGSPCDADYYLVRGARLPDALTFIRAWERERNDDAVTGAIRAGTIVSLTRVRTGGDYALRQHHPAFVTYVDAETLAWRDGDLNSSRNYAPNGDPVGDVRPSPSPRVLHQIARAWARTLDQVERQTSRDPEIRSGPDDDRR